MKVDPPWEIFENRIQALEIAASVFSQLNFTHTIESDEGEPFSSQYPRTISDFRSAVDAVFKAAGLEKVEWGDG